MPSVLLSVQPRHYPMRFARFLADRCEALKAGSLGKPEPPEILPSAINCFESMSYGCNPDLWTFANLRDVFVYLRGGNRLRIPESWQHVIPRRYPTPSSSEN